MMYFQSCDPFNSKQTTWWMRYEVGTAVVVLAIQFAQPSDCIFILLMFFFFFYARVIFGSGVFRSIRIHVDVAPSYHAFPLTTVLKILQTEQQDEVT